MLGNIILIISLNFIVQSYYIEKKNNSLNLQKKKIKASGCNQFILATFT